MNRLETELQRLYLAPAPAGQVRAVVLELARPAAWERLGQVWQGVQADFDLPAPAIAVSGIDACQLWFSFAEPVAAAQALDLLQTLQTRYLADVPAERVRGQLFDASAADDAAGLPPPVERAPGRWSAFVAQDLAGLFSDEPWLDIAPSPEAQADVLSRLKSIPPDALQRALAAAKTPATPRSAAAPVADATAGTSKAAGGASRAAGPKAFLRAVMNDPAIDLRLRIEAARALLPYSESDSE